MQIVNRSSFFYVVIAFLSVIAIPEAYGQSRTYTVVQAGGMFGVSSTSDHNAMHGYQVHLSFGRNFQDRLYAGIGLSQDVYRGSTNIMIDGNMRKSTRRMNALPIFAEARAPISSIGMLGSFGTMVSIGYAPPMGAEYFGGFMGKAGLTYGHLLADRSDLLFSVGYGFQQFDSRYVSNAFSQHNVFISIGLFVH